MVTGKLDEHLSDFTIIYGDYTPEWIAAFKDHITDNVSKIPGCSTDTTSGVYYNYFWVKREDGSTGCIRVFGRCRVKGLRWEDHRPSMLITTVKTGVNKFDDEEIYSGALMSLTPQNPIWLEAEIDNAAK